jgi:hypothetical protein
MPRSRSSVLEIECDSWDDLLRGVEKIRPNLDVQDGEFLWFRGSQDSQYSLSPSLMRDTEGLSRTDHDGIEQNLFCEFQARAAELRARGLSDWEYLFFGRHYGLPTRVLDWTDTFGIALYFAIETPDRSDTYRKVDPATRPAIWALDPYAFNFESWGRRDIILPRYLGFDTEREFWDFGELLTADSEWRWKMPVAISPIQINDRVRAQRGWFTIHGQDRRPLEVQAPTHVAKLVLTPKCVKDARSFLDFAGINRFSIYPDLENLARWLRTRNWERAQIRRKSRRSHI